MDLTTAAASASAAFIVIATQEKKRQTQPNDGSSFRDFVRLIKSDFEIVLCLLAPKISKKHTNYRAVVPPSIRDWRLLCDI